MLRIYSFLDAIILIGFILQGLLILSTVLNFARWLFSSIVGWLGRRLAVYVVLEGKISMAGPL